MLQRTESPTRPMQVVVIDHSFRHLVGWAEKFAKRMAGVQVVLLTDKSPSRKDDLLEVINVHDVEQNLDLNELQEKFQFSIYRALVTERAYFDYTTFTERECYSRVNIEQIDALMRPHVNALDEVIRTRADLIIGHLADNAIGSLAAEIAAAYGKAYAAPYFYYWWSDGYLFVDRPDQTSSQVDRFYRKFYADQSSIDEKAIRSVYRAKRAKLQYSDNLVYSWRSRIKKVVGSRHWHDPFSPLNWLMRRAFHLFSKCLTALFTRRLAEAPKGCRYVIFPMHVAPEASLLGSTPELADQISLIKNISMNLPWGVRLCVKKHPEQHKWSGPGFDFYRKLRALKNVDVIEASASIESMLRDLNCIAVATINGTVGLEAAFLRKPAFVFGKALYSVADCFLKPNDFDEFRRQMLAVVKGQFQFDDGALLAIMAAMDAAVWRGETEFVLAKTIEEAAVQSFAAIERYVRSEAWRTPATAL